MMFGFDTVIVQERASARTSCGAFVARRGLSRPATGGDGLILPAFALPEGPDSLRSSVFAFIRLAEPARPAPEMQKPRTLCGAFVARRGFELILVISNLGAHGYKNGYMLTCMREINEPASFLHSRKLVRVHCFAQVSGEGDKIDDPSVAWPS
jgi:hypothetical protein